jgi:RNA polymerase sigma-70 factor (ECF subfamily)
LDSKLNKSSINSLEIVKIKRSDVEFYEHLFKRYYQPLIRFTYRYVKDEHIAENVIQDVFLYLWNERGRLDFTINIKTYLYNAVKNRSLNYLRKKGLENKYKILEVVLDRDDQNPEVIMINNDLRNAISDCINKLPKNRREIFCMNRFDHLTYTEIASILNISIKTVETQMSRSLKFLRKKLSIFFTAVVL